MLALLVRALRLPEILDAISREDLRGASRDLTSVGLLEIRDPT